jgi:hypothetical protein
MVLFLKYRVHPITPEKYGVFHPLKKYLFLMVFLEMQNNAN